MKIKKYKSYIIGGIIGSLFGLFPINEIFTNKFVLINDFILFIPRKLVSTIFECWFCLGTQISMFIFSVLLFTSLGLVITLLLNNIIKPKQTNEQKPH